jgi:hypothetical protein
MRSGAPVVVSQIASHAPWRARKASHASFAPRGAVALVARAMRRGWPSATSHGRSLAATSGLAAVE